MAFYFGLSPNSMKQKSVEELLGLINNGFEGEVKFTGTVSLYGDSMQRADYSGDLTLKNDEGIHGPRRYEISSNDSKFKLPFAQSREAYLEHPSEGANVIKIPIYLPREYFVKIHNPRNIAY